MPRHRRPSPGGATVSEVTGLRLARPDLLARPTWARAESGKSEYSRAAIAELVSVIQSTVPETIRWSTSAGRVSASAF